MLLVGLPVDYNACLGSLREVGLGARDFHCGLIAILRRLMLFFAVTAADSGLIPRFPPSNSSFSLLIFLQQISIGQLSLAHHLIVRWFLTVQNHDGHVNRCVFLMLREYFIVLSGRCLALR